VSENTIVKGGCLCGKVLFEAHLPSMWCAHCHCSQCRKAHGAGYVTWVGFESDRFKLNTGSDQLKWYASSPGARRGFCTACGSTLFFEAERWPGETHVALGCIDGEIDRQPQANSFFDAHVDWMPIDNTLEKVSG
jgi:hypothetical protein